MPNKIQIKRSTSTAAVSGLANGELAFTQASNTLWIGLPDGSGVLSIGGARVPGTLTANQALVANSTSGIDKVIVANLVPTNIWANGSQGSAGQILSTDGAGKVYWAQQSATGVTSVATGSGLTGGPITSTGTVSVLANNGIIANTTGVFVDGANGISVDASGVNVLAGNTQLVSNTTGLWINQAQINHNGLLNYVGDQHVAHTGVTLTAGDGLTGGGDISASRTFAVGSGNGIFVAADAVSVIANSGIVSNSSGVFVNTAFIATVPVNSANNADYLDGQHGTYYLDLTNSTGTLPYARLPVNVVNTTANLDLGGLIKFVANVTFANSSGIVANGSFGTAGHVLHSNGTGLYWAADDNSGGTVTSVATGNGLTGGTITATGTISVVANNGIVANTTGVFARQANGISVDASGINVLAGNSQLVSNSTGVWVNQAQIDHNSLSNYVVNRHIDHSAVSISSGNGLTGGGDITATRTLSVVAANGISVGASGVAVTGSNGISVTSTGVNVLGSNGISVTSSGVNVLAGNSQLVSNTTGVWVNQSQIDHNSLSNYVVNRHIDHSAVSISPGNGLTGGGDITATRTLTVNANNGIVANAFGVFARQANGISVDASGINVLAGNGIVSNTTGVFAKAGTGVTVDTNGINIGQAVGTTSDVTFNKVTTVSDVTIGGNLIVGGSTTTVNSQSLLVRDNMIGLADNQNDTTVFIDAVDSGFYVSSGNTLNSFYSGIARIAASSSNTNPLFRVFSTATLPNSTIIDTGMNTGTLQSFLAPWGSGGAFVVNTSAMAFTANTTVSLNMVANTLSLTTALPAGSGGTGFSTYTAGDLLVASGTSSLSKLGVGADGTVLQISGTTVQWNTLDGGTF